MHSSMFAHASSRVRFPVFAPRNTRCRISGIHGASRSIATPYPGAMSMWLTPCRKTSSTARSTASWLSSFFPMAMAPNVTTVLMCPVRPSLRFSMSTHPI